MVLFKLLKIKFEQPSTMHMVAPIIRLWTHKTNSLHTKYCTNVFPHSCTRVHYLLHHSSLLNWTLEVQWYHFISCWFQFISQMHCIESLLHCCFVWHNVQVMNVSFWKFTHLLVGLYNFYYIHSRSDMIMVQDVLWIYHIYRHDTLLHDL